MTGVLRRLLTQSDLVASVAVVTVVVMMVVPLPPPLLDLLIVLDLAAALSILVATMYVPQALELAAFPSLLLLTTLFRLGINISVTRQILLHGEAGGVVHAFGSFVVGGNLVVGIVVFSILMVIQYVVITNGSGRVAEVAARFTLDAMPGKQMAIDADLNAGLITEAEARARRSEITRDADFYGAMDGASKFVKGDALAGVLIVIINLLAGIAIGVLQLGLSFSEATQTFSLLSIGDGLAAAIPALLISTATGILVTRAASDGHLGGDIVAQFARQPRSSAVAGAVICGIALVPGMPKLPFLVVGSLVFFGGRALSAIATAQAAERERAEVERAREAMPPAADPGAAAVGVDPLELAIGFGLVPLADTRSGGGLLARVGAVRRQLANELGALIAPVRIHDDVALASHDYLVKVRGTEVARGAIVPGHLLAMNAGDSTLGLSGIPTVEPAFGLPAVWIEEGARAEAEALGYTVVDAESVIVTHLTETIRRHVDELLTRQETKKLLDTLREQNAAAVEEVVPDKLGIGEVQRVLQHLLREGVPIRDLGTILETIGDRAMLTRDPSALAEYARQALGRTITAGYVDEDATLRVISLDPGLEQEVAEAVAHTPEGDVLALDPARTQDLVGSLGGQLERAAAAGLRPVLLCSSRVRRHLRHLLEHSFPALPILAYSEVAPGVRVETTGMVTA
jgi:flagellar biosynthesis protein FlhA